ncbi:DUF1656 domain-containing protein [Pigmentiphaga soli]|uniref:DUF1656 domain-containing protein n=1 Tax=Pigmentiphaga soli TaxID=1007095 RepID=A0ABP8HQJ7_9BURK
MTGEISLYGIYVPWLLVLAFAALGATWLLRRTLAGVGFYRLVWHAALFDLALFVVVLYALSRLFPYLT